MPGKKGMTGKGLGGKRAGAGRPPKSARLTDGMTLMMSESSDQGTTLPYRGTVEITKRGALHILREDGSRINIIY